MLVMRDNEELFYGTSGFANEQKEAITRDVSVHKALIKHTFAFSKISNYV